MATATTATDTAAAVEAPAAHPTTGQPWAYIPILYFLEGLPNILVTAFAGLMFKDLGITNDRIGLWTNLIALAWTAKMLWGPLVDLTLTKRRWTLLTQGLMVLLIAALAWAVTLPSFFTACLVMLTGLAFVSATHDIAADGFYLLALDKQTQAFFVGVRSTFYRLSVMFGSGTLIWLAGSLALLHSPEGEGASKVPGWLASLDSAAAPLVADPTRRSWALALGFGALVYGLLFVVNSLLLPKPPTDSPEHRPAPGEQVPWKEAFAAFFQQPKIFWILSFIVFYRFGESMIGTMSGLFLRDTVDKGGLGVPTAVIGSITGYYGVAALTLGGILGGFVISKYGIKRCLWPMVLSLNVPNLFYVWAAFAHPGIESVKWLIAVDQFGYGFGFSAYMVYLMFICQGSRYETSSYAIATGLMALGARGAGMLSGYLQTSLGYANFFIVVCLLTIPGMITLFFIPLDKKDVFTAPVDLD